MLNKSIINIRVMLQNADIKKSGKNKFQGFEYYELKDFLPTLNELMKSEGVNDLFSIKDGQATLTLMKDEESQTYEMPFERFETPLTKSGTPSMQDIQYLGALNTYYKRYLYLNAFGITDGEIIDGMDVKDLQQNKTEKLKVEAEKADKKLAKIKELRAAIKQECERVEMDIKDASALYKLGKAQKPTVETFEKALKSLQALKTEADA